MFSCSDCYFWRSHGHRLGVCTYEPLNPEGTVAPVSADACGIQLAIEYSGHTATAAETVCLNYEPVDDSVLDQLDEAEDEE